MSALTQRDEAAAKREFPGVKRLETERKTLKKDDEKYKSAARTVKTETKKADLSELEN
jgi:hypothetical protein